ncbi:hypothetical protein [Crenothrix sp.]|uniref:hypothetical protein n=1 Tax=Crenothrix sp. TaxID=3100433 RepID=UPI00374CCDB0
MKTLLSIVSAAILGVAASTASAAPVQLTTAQLDNVTAGSYYYHYYYNNTAYADALAFGWNTSTSTFTFAAPGVSQSSSYSCSGYYC